MAIRTYYVAITGKTPLLMHADNVEWADAMEAWKNAPANKGISKAGDDRSPAWRWIGTLHNNIEHVVIPNDMLAPCLMGGGAMVPVPGGKNGKTFKSQTQSGLAIVEEAWPLLIQHTPIPYGVIEALLGNSDFAEHKAKVQELGFALKVQRARIGQNKHIRVRPRFDSWAAEGTMRVWDDQITTEVLQQILFYAGAYKGLGDWRPGGKTPGPWGTFSAEVQAI